MVRIKKIKKNKINGVSSIIKTMYRDYVRRGDKNIALKLNKKFNKLKLHRVSKKKRTIKEYCEVTKRISKKYGNLIYTKKDLDSVLVLVAIRLFQIVVTQLMLKTQEKKRILPNIPVYRFAWRGRIRLQIYKKINIKIKKKDRKSVV